MTTSLFTAVNANATTTNGCITNTSSLNKNVDLFFLAGASRGKDIKHILASALVEDPEVACRILLHTRDARSGSGERETFRNLFQYLIKADAKLASRVLTKIPELGRFDDLYVAFGTPLERQALSIFAKALNDGNALAAKWSDRKGPNASKMRSYLKLTPKEYRKLIVTLSQTVESKMCAQEWTEINYSHVPSVAAARYQKAFGKHDPTGYTEYKENLVKGETKINASVVYPYDIIRSLKNGDETVSNAQWAALPDYLEGSDENILPIVDVSGSMTVQVSGSITALDVSTSLGLYLSERSNGIFKDQFVTFSTKPEFVKVAGTLRQKYDQMSRSNWAMSTDLQAVFNLILDSAVKHKVNQKDMPTKLLIMSDMNFNQCIHNGTSVSSMEMIEKSYKDAGYVKPSVIFWNISGNDGNSPVTHDKIGIALVSGLSPSIVKSVLGGEDLSPMSVMLRTVMVQRYDF